MREITAAAVQETKSLKADIPIVNVLSPDAFDHEHIPGSVNCPVDSPHFASNVERLVPSLEAPVIVYCAHEGCPAAEDAARALESAGFDQILVFKGGMRRWRSEGFEVASEE